MEIPQTDATWEEILGKNNWEGLLDPLDDGLRHLILRCGDLCQATYDSFNNDENSKYAGSCRYGKENFFYKVMFPAADDYRVFAYLYAAARVSHIEAMFFSSKSRESWDRESNWIGYIAVTSDEVSAALGRREIYVPWRGTTRDYEWINVLGAKSEEANILLKPKSWVKKSANDKDDDDDGDEVPRVMRGWLSIYTTSDPRSEFTNHSARDQLQSKIHQLLRKYKDENVSIITTGHSLGASLAILCAFDLVENGITEIPVTAIVFGSPQVGNKEFNERLHKFPNLNVLHVRNKTDTIPLYPSWLLGYRDTGVQFEIDNRKSPFLRPDSSIGDRHNLQAMLHVVAGWNGAHGEFKMRVKRSLALVNKSAEIIREDYRIPGAWWVEKNKGMVRDADGEWILAPPADEDQPVPEEFDD